MALGEAKRKGMVPFCLTVDRAGHDYLKTMCEDIGYEVVADIRFLGRRLRAPAPVAADLTYVDPAFGLARYPHPVTGLAPVDLITAAIAARDLMTAERVVTWIAQQLGV